MQSLNQLKGFLFEGASLAPSIIIYAPKISARLQYVCKFIFNQGLLVNFNLTDNENEFLRSELTKINYSVKTFDNAFNISASGVLNDTRLQKPELDNTKEGFDIFSAVFYHISRCEEWLSDKTDEHGRFVQETEMKVPQVDVWISELKSALSTRFKSLQFPSRHFRFVSTIDVDNVYAYKAKPVYRQGGGVLKDMLKLDLENLRSRLNSVLLGKKDPFDEYALQVELSKKYNVPLIYFFLYKNNTEYDRTIDPGHPEFIKLLEFMKANSILCGLHPSYNSSVNYNLLEQEQKSLSKDLGAAVTCSRQHFLRFNIKTTPKDLIKAGISYDFTMGFADKPGFRAATTLPFFYYDFETESELPLLAVPFAAMDGAFYMHQDNNANEAYYELMDLAALVRSVNGLFITVIHDRSFSNAIAPGWKDLYLKLHQNLTADYTD